MAAGADALLLIAAALPAEQLRHFVELANRLRIVPLVEVHTASELDRALAAGGNGAQAARVMDECHAAFADAGVAVSPETERVYREVSGAGSPRAPSRSTRRTAPRK